MNRPAWIEELLQLLQNPSNRFVREMMQEAIDKDRVERAEAARKFGGFEIGLNEPATVSSTRDAIDR